MQPSVGAARRWWWYCSFPAASASGSWCCFSWPCSCPAGSAAACGAGWNGGAASPTDAPWPSLRSAARMPFAVSPLPTCCKVLLALEGFPWATHSPVRGGQAWVGARLQLGAVCLVNSGVPSSGILGGCSDHGPEGLSKPHPLFPSSTFSWTQCCPSVSVCRKGA